MGDQGSFYQRDRGWHPPPLTPQYKTSVLRSPQRALLSLENTISEMTGPVFGHGVIGQFDNDLIRNWAGTGDPIGPRILVHGRVLDEHGRGVPGALLEFWQANAGGRWIPISAAAGGRSPTSTAATSSAPSGRAPIRGPTASTTGGPPTSISRCSATRSPSG